MRTLSCLLLVLIAATASISQQPIELRIVADSGRIAVSPGLWGFNNTVTQMVANDDLFMQHRAREAGVRVFRENNGNNATKYNWRRRITSHPDWFNNVYGSDWDARARRIVDSLPQAQGLFAFQLLGKVAATDNANWNDWAYYQTHGRVPPRHLDLAGGGVLAAGDTSLAVRGDASRYLMDWPADSTTGILSHWFGAGGLGLDARRFVWWNMDNEPDIWNGTHDDVERDTVSFESFFTRYVTVALAARRKADSLGISIRLVGPVLTNEWQWWTWNNRTIQAESRTWSPMEWFLRRISQEEARTGVRLLDVFDLHAYPNYNDLASRTRALQYHRIWFDTSYLWPDANGIHMFGGNWGQSASYHLFERIRGWMRHHLGEERGLAITEWGAVGVGGDRDTRAAVYAAHLATFADQGVEVFCPWDWHEEWWEVLSMFSRLTGPVRVASTHRAPEDLAALATLSTSGDTLIVHLVNLASTARTVQLHINGFERQNDSAKIRLLDEIPPDTTFYSWTHNAQVVRQVSIPDGRIELPPGSVAVVRMAGQVDVPLASIQGSSGFGGVRLVRSDGRALLKASPGALLEEVEVLSVHGQVLRRFQPKVAIWEVPADLSGLLVIRVRSQGVVSVHRLLKMP